MRKLLIIEDDALVARVYQGLFQHAGYQVEIASDGQTGLMRILEGRPYGVLLDLMLPQLNGLDLLKKIRSHRDFDKLVILVFTNSYLPEMWEEARRYGANQVFHKSRIRPKEIVDAMNQGGTDSKATAPPSPLPVPGLPAVAPTAPGVPEVPTSLPGSSPGPSRSMPALPETESDLRHSLLGGVVRSFAAMQEVLSRLDRCHEDAECQACLIDFYRKLHAFSGICSMAGLRPLAEVSAALEALVIELHQDPKQLTISTRQTVADAFELIRSRFNPDPRALVFAWHGTRALVLDDELMARRAILLGLQRAGFQASELEGASNALDLLQRNRFEIIVLDTDLPGTDSEAWLRQMRALPDYSNTPVIRVAPLGVLTDHTHMLAPSEDLIGEPFLTMEMAVKAIRGVLTVRWAATP